MIDTNNEDRRDVESELSEVRKQLGDISSLLLRLQGGQSTLEGRLREGFDKATEREELLEAKIISLSSPQTVPQTALPQTAAGLPQQGIDILTHRDQWNVRPEFDHEGRPSIAQKGFLDMRNFNNKETIIKHNSNILDYFRTQINHILMCFRMRHYQESNDIISSNGERSNQITRTRCVSDTHF